MAKSVDDLNIKSQYDPFIQMYTIGSCFPYMCTTNTKKRELVEKALRKRLEQLGLHDWVVVEFYHSYREHFFGCVSFCFAFTKLSQTAEAKYKKFITLLRIDFRLTEADFQ